MSQDLHAFFALGPEQVIAAVESIGLPCDGHMLGLNSYENRVYRIGLEERPAIVAKFYRPARWSDAAIIEEHRFTRELAELDIPVVAPLDIDGETLFCHQGFRFALYPLSPGREPELDNREHLCQLGRYLGRIHAAGCLESFTARPTLNIDAFGRQSCDYLLRHDFIPPHLRLSYETLCEQLLQLAEALFARAGHVQLIRLHGDCHAGNILWHQTEGPHIVDFDDARTGPAIQDLWMFLSGSKAHMESCLATLLEGYTQFHDFDIRELNLIEALRTLRMMHYSAWLARRWSDPAFRHAFPWFNDTHYWEDHLLALKEQAALMQEEPLQWI